MYDLFTSIFSAACTIPDSMAHNDFQISAWMNSSFIYPYHNPLRTMTSATMITLSSSQTKYLHQYLTFSLPSHKVLGFWRLKFDSSLFESYGILILFPYALTFLYILFMYLYHLLFRMYIFPGITSYLFSGFGSCQVQCLAHGHWSLWGWIYWNSNKTKSFNNTGSTHTASYS